MPNRLTLMPLQNQKVIMKDLSPMFLQCFLEAFVDGGPMTGTKKTANVFLAGTDRIAIDAVAVAILKGLGSTKEIMEKKVFEQEQIARAVELKLGIDSPAAIEIITGDQESELYARKIKQILIA